MNINWSFRPGKTFLLNEMQVFFREGAVLWIPSLLGFLLSSFLCVSLLWYCVCWKLSHPSVCSSLTDSWVMLGGTCCKPALFNVFRTDKWEPLLMIPSFQFFLPKPQLAAGSLKVFSCLQTSSSPYFSRFALIMDNSLSPLKNCQLP